MKDYTQFYASAFDDVANVVRFGKPDDTKISYGVMVGDENGDGKTFLGGEFFMVEDFTTWNDAENAKLLAECALSHVDDSLNAKAAKALPDGYRLLVETMRDSVLAIIDAAPGNQFCKRESCRAVANFFNGYLKTCSAPPTENLPMFT